MKISIHAPRVRGDHGAASEAPREREISIHAPRVRGDAARSLRILVRSISIHAPRVRGDWTTSSARTRSTHFNPRPSGEGRRFRVKAGYEVEFISIHAPRVRGDRKMFACFFLPTNILYRCLHEHCRKSNAPLTFPAKLPHRKARTLRLNNASLMLAPEQLRCYRARKPSAS